MRFIFYIAVLWCSISFGLGQKPEISIDFNTVETGDPVMVKVKSPIPGNLEITFPDEFVAGSSIQSGMNQEMNYNTGKVTTVYFYSQNGAFTKEGTYTLRAIISDKGKTYKSKAITVKVQKQAPANQPLSKRNLKQPIFGTVERSKARVYEGEPLIVNGKVYSKLKVEVQGYHPFEIVGNAEVINLNSSNDLIFGPEMIKGQKYATAQFGKQLMFFTTPGKYQINPYEMAVVYEIEENYPENSVFTSNGNSIEVIPLPDGAPDDFIGAVGKYQLSRSFDKTTAKQGDVVTMTLVISGHGNLHNINTPELKLPKGIVVYGDPEVSEDISFGLRGAEGKITYKYNLQILQPGDFQLATLSVSYFDPELKKYVRLQEKGGQIVGESSDSFRAQLPKEIEKQNSEKSGLQPVLTTASDEDDNYFIHSVLFWPTVVSPFALAFVGGLFFTRRKKMAEKISEKAKTKDRAHAVHQLLKSAAVKADAGETQEGFAHIQQALKTAASIVIQSENTNLTKLEIQQGLEEMDYDPAKIEQFNRLLLQCEEARYAFMDQSDLFRKTLSETEKLTQNIH